MAFRSAWAGSGVEALAGPAGLADGAVAGTEREGATAPGGGEEAGSDPDSNPAGEAAGAAAAADGGVVTCEGVPPQAATLAARTTTPAARAHRDPNLRTALSSSRVNGRSVANRRRREARRT